MKRIVSAVAALLVAGVATNAWAAGFAVSTHSGRATGMATAVTAGIDDASAVLYNPANISIGEGLKLQLGDSMIIPGFKADFNGQTTKVDTVPVFPPHFYATYGMGDTVAFGVGVFSPFGLAVHWPAGWQGSELITDASLKTFFINPEVAFHFSMLRIGGGVEIVYGDINLQRQPKQSVGPVSVSFHSKLTGSAWGVGGNAGASLEVIPKFLTLGASYRSPVKLKFDNGKAEFTDVPGPLQAFIQNTDATAAITLPQTLSLGIALYPSEKLWIGLDTMYYGWQSIQNISIDFANPLIPDTVQPKNWTYMWNYHVGAEYKFTDAFRGRLGVEYDPTPSPENTLTPDIPDGDRINLAAGIGAKFGTVTGDLGYEFINFFKHKSTFPQFPATYFGTAHVISLTLGTAM